jgi:hypothetical protein
MSGKTEVARQCSTCPLLYWAIVSIGSKASGDYKNTIPLLTWPIRRLATETSLQPPTLPVVQALLLLCLWPLPFAATIDDPSWTFNGIAAHKALQMGLHRPNNVDAAAAHAMTATWLACVVVNQS